MSPEEILAFTHEPWAVFGTEAQLVLVNEPFRKLFPRLDVYLAAGTPWSMLLSEAVRQDVLSSASAHQLSIAEEGLTDPAAPARELDVETSAGPLRFALKATADGGFALRLSQASHGQAEGELEHLMARVLEACPTCLTMARIGDGQILYRSPEATALLGKGFNSREHFALREERADFITELLPNARVDDMRISARRADGSPFPASISARLIDYRGEDVIVSSIVDLTDELKMRQELDRQRQQVFRSEKMSALGEVLAGVAHELNNPLSIIVGNAQLLAEDGVEGPAQKRVERVADAAERCVSIVRAFLSMARDRPLRLEEIPPLDLLQTAKDAFEASGTTEIDVRIASAPDLPDLRVDEVQVVQVLTNLMVNAEHALGPQTDARIELQVSPAPDGRGIRIRVSDNGPGIPADVAPRIFDPLFTTKDAGKGTGIGLALCHRIIAAHGGSIELDQREDRGASFVIDFPAAGLLVPSPTG
ncbi:MAG: ATP-binding protein [Pseudomonadota bacterium]